MIYVLVEIKLIDGFWGEKPSSMMYHMIFEPSIFFHNCDDYKFRNEYFPKILEACVSGIKKYFSRLNKFWFII